jgi:BTB/POZ domain-containing adapter for CUL3-mediated RhoA degradation protein
MKDKDANGHDVVPVCRVPLITSQREEQALINACATKPVVKLLINRHNNKYSYTGASDDNLLKNIELFDKLSLRFSNRVLFIKDVIGSNEICCWSVVGVFMATERKLPKFAVQPLSTQLIARIRR